MAVEVKVLWRRVSDDPALFDLLDQSERARAARRSNPARYATAHALLRTGVGEWLGVEPETVRFDRTCATCGSRRHGKPRVTGHPGLFVSLSYAGDLAVVALSGDGEVGVDVEELDESDFDGFNVVTLDEVEVAALDALGGEALRRARAQVWARKESVLKASGHGLVVDPRQVIVTGPKEQPALVSWRGEHPLDGPVQLADVELGDPSHVAAVAVLAPDPLTLRVLSG